MPASLIGTASPQTGADTQIPSLNGVPILNELEYIIIKHAHGKPDPADHALAETD